VVKKGSKKSCGVGDHDAASDKAVSHALDWNECRQSILAVNTALMSLSAVYGSLCTLDATVTSMRNRITRRRVASTSSGTPPAAAKLWLACPRSAPSNKIGTLSC